jgi:hypothetical protein
MRTGACKQLTKSPLADAGAVHSLSKQLETYIVEFRYLITCTVPVSGHLLQALPEGQQGPAGQAPQ